ncbi:MAG: manganese efflux pump MntP family protein [Myxococcota bacterium]
MTFGAILVLSVGLAMDATAASAARGMAARVVGLRHALLVASFFGGFQALMPLAGWKLGKKLGPLVQAWDHWIAFALLGAIGGKMLWEAYAEADEPSTATTEDSGEQAFRIKVLFVLAVATSIDAFAAGITLPILGAPLVLSLATIGVTTAILSTLGLFAGRRFGALLGKRLDVVGGLVLIALGTKILVEHLR